MLKYFAVRDGDGERARGISQRIEQVLMSSSTGGEAAAIERNERPKLRRNDRHHGQDHPFGLVARLDEGLDHLETLGQLLRLQLGRRLGDLHAQVGGDLLEIESFEQLADRLSMDLGLF